MIKKKWFFWLIVVLPLILLSSCTKSQSQNNGKIRVVTSTNIYADIAHNILGKYGKVSAIIKNGDTDPHDFEPTVRSAKEVDHADIVVANGLGYDSWMDNLASSNNLKVMHVGEDLFDLKKGDNPHIWYNLQMPYKYVHYLLKKADKLQPEHKNYFAFRSREYLAKIKKVKRLSRQINGSASKPVFVSEPVFDYALEGCGFKVSDGAFERAVEDEVDPSPTTVDKMERSIKEKKIAFFVNNTQASSSTVNNFVKLAHRHGVPVLNVRETKPNGISYFHWLFESYERLEKVSKK